MLKNLARLCGITAHCSSVSMCVVQYGIEFAAEHVLPLLTPLLIAQQLNVQQFAKCMLFVKDILTQVLHILSLNSPIYLVFSSEMLCSHHQIALKCFPFLSLSVAVP